MNRVERLYEALPPSLQHVAASAEGLRSYRDRYGTGFSRLLGEVEARGRWSHAALEEFRDERLRRFLQSSATIPFYRSRFAEAQVDVRDVRGLADMASLPVLSKAEVQAAGDAVRCGPGGGRRTVPMHTSGTTGAGLRFLASRESVRETWAVWWRYRRRHGLTLRTWQALVGGRVVVPLAQQEPPFWRYNVPHRQLAFSPYHMQPEHLDAYVAELRRRRLPWLHGFPSQLVHLAQHLQDGGEPLGYQLRWLTVGAENLLTHQRLLLEEVFGVRVLQHYGLAEGVANASECAEGRLHVDEDHAAVELLPVGDGTHRIIGTNLSNAVTPLIRYDTGDIAVVLEGCGCGLAGRVLERIDGRLEDYVVFRDGTRYGRMDHIFKDMTNIAEAQIRQSVAGHLDLHLVRTDRYRDADEQLLMEEVRRRVPPDTTVTLHYEQALPRTASGKLRFVLSTLPGNRIADDGRS